ncbi:MAG TPA: FecR domain-containing protein [Chitinophagaceae bacterium]|nr:FecR domain-containing protein [Chitinophagaceae bacterium]
MEADEKNAWDALRLKLGKQPQVERKNDVISGDFTKKTFSIARWTAVAAVSIIVIGSFLWYLNSDNKNVYQTGFDEQRTVLLPDGSTIKLSADTRIEVSKKFNKSNRLMDLKTGEAYFEVKHDEQIPFIVNLGLTSVKDIGTSFLIQRQADSIKLNVINGKVAFINNSNNETRELSAGMSLRIQIGTKTFNPVISTDSLTVQQSSLHFDKTALADVILSLEKTYNRKIVLVDSALAQKRFTANLDGQSFEGAIEILSKSLTIKYFEMDGVYYLKTEQ